MEDTWPYFRITARRGGTGYATLADLLAHVGRYGYPTDHQQSRSRRGLSKSHRGRGAIQMAAWLPGPAQGADGCAYERDLPIHLSGRSPADNAALSGCGCWLLRQLWHKCRDQFSP